MLGVLLDFGQLRGASAKILGEAYERCQRHLDCQTRADVSMLAGPVAVGDGDGHRACDSPNSRFVLAGLAGP